MNYQFLLHTTPVLLAYAFQRYLQSHPRLNAVVEAIFHPWRVQQRLKERFEQRDKERHKNPLLYIQQQLLPSRYRPLPQSMNNNVFRFRKLLRRGLWPRQQKQFRRWTTKKKTIYGRRKRFLQRRIRRIARRLYRRTRRKYIYRRRQNRTNTWNRKINRWKTSYATLRNAIFPFPNRLFMAITWKHQISVDFFINCTSNVLGDSFDRNLDRLDNYPWITYCFSLNNPLTPILGAAIVAWQRDASTTPAHWVCKQRDVGGFKITCPYGIAKLAPLYEKLRVWGSSWKFRISKYTINSFEQTSTIQAFNTKTMRVYMFLPEDRKNYAFYTYPHLKRTHHKMKETIIEPEMVWTSNNYMHLDPKRKTSAVLSTGYIPIYKIITSVHNSKKAYKEDPVLNWRLNEQQFENVVPRNLNEPLYLCFQLLHDRDWGSHLNVNGLKINMHLLVNVRARFWVEWNDLREWLQDVAVDLTNTLLNSYFFPPDGIFEQIPSVLPAEPTPPPREYYPPRGADAITDTLPKFIPWATRETDDTKHIRSDWNFETTEQPL